jgi:hypothetical protein
MTDNQTIMIPVHPSEMTGKAGFGIFAFLTHKDAVDCRKLLSSLRMG